MWGWQERRVLKIILAPNGGTAQKEWVTFKVRMHISVSGYISLMNSTQLGGDSVCRAEKRRGSRFKPQYGLNLGGVLDTFRALLGYH